MQNKKCLPILSQRGIGLIGAVVSAALVVVIAFVISRFIVDQNKTSMQLESSTMCQQILKTTMDYLAKDDNSLNITTYGPVPGSPLFNPNADVTVDGHPRFLFNGAPVPGHVRVDGSPVTAPLAGLMTTNTPVAVPASVRFTNFLNKRNTYSRLITLAGNRDVCFEDFDGDGGIIFETNGANNLAGLIIEEGVAEIRLFVDPRENDTSLCDGAGGVSRLPDPKLQNELKYKVRVITNEGENTQKGCESSASVFIGQDTVAPFTILTLNNGTSATPNNINPALCAGKIGSPSLCASNQIVTINLSTITDEEGVDAFGRNCNQCMGILRNNSCQLGGGALFNNNEICVTRGATRRACKTIDPGSIYLCRIGEVNWFNNQGRNYWQPCHQARVWRWDPVANTHVPVGPDGNVRITYLRDTAQVAQTDRTTTAQITITDLPQMAYAVDVRAVDSAGAMIGPAYCALADCASVPTFVVNTNGVNLTPLEPERLIVGAVNDSVLGSSIIPTPTGALAPFGTNLFQCASSTAERFTTDSSYTVPPGASANLGVSGTCTSQYTGTGSVSACTCDDGGRCTVTAGATGVAGGNQSVQLNFNNECGHTNNTLGNWCYDPTVNFTVTTSHTNPSGVNPSFSMNNGGKACGLSTQCPGITTHANYSLGSCTAINDWAANIQNPGCIAVPGKQYCARGFDPCGRNFESPASYSSLLPLATTGNNNLCQTINGTLVGGNRCASGWCNNSTQCQTGCAMPATCENSSECVDANTCSGTTGTCNGVVWNCNSASGTLNGIGCSATGNACTNSYTCNGVSAADSRCSNNLSQTCTIDANCTAPGTCVPTGDCSVSGNACRFDSQCREIGTCSVQTPGSCACPTNTTCEKCPPNGTPRVCAQANACEPATLPTMAGLTCGAPPICIPNWTETSRTPCSATVCGTAGTVTINESCVNSCGVACGTRSRLEPCTAEACGKWCPSGREDACLGDINPAGGCAVGQMGHVNFPCCSDTPQCYMSYAYECVPTTQTCAGAPMPPGSCSCEEYTHGMCAGSPVPGGCKVICGGATVYYICR